MLMFVTSRSCSLDFCLQGYLFKNRADLKAQEHITSKNDATSTSMDFPSVFFSLMPTASDGFHKLCDHLVESMDFIIKENNAICIEQLCPGVLLTLMYLDFWQGGSYMLSES